MNGEVTIAGPRPLRGSLRLPGDKGISHRALLVAALASGRSTIRNLADGDDVRRTRLAIEQLGVGMKASGSDDAGGVLMVQSTGVDGLREPDAVIDCGNSGTTMRTLFDSVCPRVTLSSFPTSAPCRSARTR